MTNGLRERHGGKHNTIITDSNGTNRNSSREAAKSAKENPDGEYGSGLISAAFAAQVSRQGGREMRNCKHRVAESLRRPSAR